MDIRRARADDLEQIIELFQQGFTPEIQQAFVIEIETHFLDEKYAFFVAEEGAQIVGHARVYHVEPDKALLGALVVDKAHQNRGVATALTRARLNYLRKNNFQGTALSDAVTHHPYSQQQLYSAGFSPVRVLPGHMPDHSVGPETAIGFAQLFSPTDVWKPESTEISIYLTPEYREVATATLAPFGSVQYKDTTTSAGERTRSFATSDEITSPKKVFRINLYEPSAPADIALMQSKGYIIASFFPVIHDTKISAVAHMYKPAAVALDRNRIHVIPAAQKLFDFVFEQYARLR